VKVARVTLQAAFAAAAFTVLAVGVMGGARAFLLSVDTVMSPPPQVRSQAAYSR
jgi:hypothetical protein